MVKSKNINRKVKIAHLDKYYKNNGNKSKVVIENDLIYNIILNQSNFKSNTNKFFISQLIKNGQNKFTLFSRYGRIGYPGIIETKNFKSKESGIKAYKELLKLKNKGYQEIKMNTEIDLLVKNNKKNKILNKEKEVVDFIELIFNKNLLENNLRSLGYDEQNLPLLNLTEEMITKGFEILEKLEISINKNKKDEILYYNDLYYSTIPHNIGFDSLYNYYICDKKKLSSENTKLIEMRNLKNSNELISLGINRTTKEKYDMLNANISLINENDLVYSYITNALFTTNINYRLKIESIFKVERKDEVFNSDIGNSNLLWYGSPISNFVGLISQGLKMPMKDALHKKYQNGKGIYLANCSNLSLQYSKATQKGDIGLLLLVEAALGNSAKGTEFNKKQDNSIYIGHKLECKENLIDEVN